MMWTSVVAAAALATVASAQTGYGSSNTSSGALPTVDLGYEIYRASSFNSTGRYYSFTNIRYAAPPTGENRWRAPVAPKPNRTVIQPGLPDRICPQATPAWQLIAAQFIPQYLSTGKTDYNASSFNFTIPGVTPGVPAVSASSAQAFAGIVPAADPRTTEDCLFLDVVVPEGIFGSRHRGYGAPVLVWIYGGGYTGGSKSGSGNPAGLLARSENNGGQGVIYVSLNYRLGAFGFLSGPTFQTDGTANAALHDQRFALQWVKANIARFGGDPNRITVFGESAGGGSIEHQITAYGGNRGAAPFNQAVLQSPGWQPVVSNQQQEQTYQYFLDLLNVSSIAEARKLPFSALQLANSLQVGLSSYGGYTYGPTVDGDFVPALPGELLLRGKFDKSVRVMLGHNAQEGLLFTPPFIQNTSALAAQVNTLLPTTRAWPAVTNYIVNTLYPATYDGSQAQNYTNIVARTAALVAELVFTCNTYYFDKAYNNQTYAYFFTVPPALHGDDIKYTYYNGANLASVPVAIALQEYITNFAETGNPNEDGVPYFNMWGSNATVQTLSAAGISQMRDPTANARCDYWQKALYL